MEFNTFGFGFFVAVAIFVGFKIIKSKLINDFRQKNPHMF